MVSPSVVRKSLKKPIIFGVLIIVLGFVNSGYVVHIISDGVTSMRWFKGDYPVEIRIWDGFTDELSQVVKGSDPQTAVKEALERWMRSTSITFVLGENTSVSDSGFDRINLVTVADTKVNKALFSGATIGVSVGTYVESTGRLLDKDLVLNPSKTWTTIENSGANDQIIFDTALHEFGHHLNLSHSVSRSSIMFHGRARVFGQHRALSWDDIAGANMTYPMVGLGQITGNVTGKVTRAGLPVFGAFVVAVDKYGALSANTITRVDGTYNLDLLPPGQYTFYVEPLDGPSTPSKFGNGIFGQSTQSVVVDFLPKFFNDSMNPVTTVIAGKTVSKIDFQVTQGDASLDPHYVETGVDSSKVLSFSVDPAMVDQGVNTKVYVGGKGVDSLADTQGVFSLSDKLVTGSVDSAGTLSNGDQVKGYDLSVPLTTPKGEFPVFLKNNTSEIGVMTGALRVLHPFRSLQVFGQFADIPGSINSGVFLINTSLSKSVHGKIMARGSNGGRKVIGLGQLTHDVNQDLDFNLASGGTLSVTTSGALRLFRSPFTGSLRIRTDRRIGGTVLYESDSGTTGVGPSRSLHTFLAPIEVRDSGVTVNTGIAVTNLDDRPCKVYIQLQAANGQLSGNTILDLDGNGHSARFINDLISGMPSDFDGSVLVTANRPVGATIISTRPGIFTTFPVIQNRILKRSFFPQFAHVGDLSSKLILLNPSSEKTARATIKVRSQSGDSASVTMSGELLSDGTKSLSIPPLGSVILETQSNVLGSLELTTQDNPVGGVVLFNSPVTGTTGVGEGFPQTDFVVPIDRSAPDIDTGIAIVNAGDTQVSLNLVVRNTGGTIVTSKTIVLGARQQLAEFPNDSTLNLGLPDTFVGSLWVQASDDVAAIVIRVSPGVLTTFPVVPLSEFTTQSD